MKRKRCRAGAALLAGLALAGCGGGAAPTAGEMNASYEAALARTAPLAAAAGADAGLARAQAFFADMAAGQVRSRALETYAAQAYLNDTVATVTGAAAIGEYFARTLGRVESLRVEFLDVAGAGTDRFVRWRMTVRTAGLNGGEPMASYGVTQFRFDAQGRILLHKDFWDAGTGLHEYLPGIGAVLRRVRSAADGG